MNQKKGIITGLNMQRTATVTVHGSKMHPVYKKRYRDSRKFLADTNGLDLHMGDEVLIEECKPISKRKCFKVIQILKEAPRVSEMKDEADTKKKEKEEKEPVSSESTPAS